MHIYIYRKSKKNPYNLIFITKESIHFATNNNNKIYKKDS